jgi:hypothetical protein
MPLNPSIALGVRPLEVPNQLAQYSQLAQIQNAQNQNALAQYQLGSAQRAENVQNAMSKAYSESIDPATGQVNYNTLIGKLAAGGAGAQIPGVEKTRKELETAALQQQELKTKLATAKTAQFRDQLTNVNSPEAAAQWTIAMYKDPHLSGTVSSVPLEAALAEIPKTPQEFDLWKKQNSLGMAEFIKQNKPTTQVVDQSGQRQVLQIPGLGGLPTSVGTYADVPLPANVEEQKGRIAKLGASQNITNVNAFAPASVEAQKQFVQAAADERKVLRNAPDTLTNIEAAIKLIPTAKTFMGKGGEPLLAAASFLNNRLGFGISTEGVTDATVLRTRLFEGILDNLKKLDSQPSQEQQRVLSEALGNLGTDPAALEQILNRIGETVRSRVDRFNTDVTDAEKRGVKFPFTPQITLPAPKFAPGAAAAQIPGQGSAPAPTIPPAAINLLKSGKGTDAQFDAIFGAGAAKRVRGNN